MELHHQRPANCGKIIEHATGLEFAEPLSKPEWLDLLSNEVQRYRISHWRLADTINHGVQQWGSKYTEAQCRTLMDVQTLMNIAWVGRAFEISRRRENLTFSHHAAVIEMTGVPIEQQDALLRQAEENKLSVSDLRQTLRANLRTTEQVEPERGVNLSAWFADGMRMLNPNKTEHWLGPQRRAFELQWEKLAELAELALKP